MAYKIKSKKEKEQYQYILKHNIPRSVKERYLRNIGLFKERAIREMSNNQIDEMCEVGLKVKGIIKENNSFEEVKIRNAVYTQKKGRRLGLV